MAVNRKIKKVLIANRGEIAVRVIRTCQSMGISTVAVFSEADRDSPHVVLADEAYLIGPAPSRESYLKADKIIAVALKSGADAIHPGYGFLSENSEFADQVTQAGLLFIGPDAISIRQMGNKLAAKTAARHFDIPMVPGTEDAIGDLDAAKRIAVEIGFPVLIKAAAGGGGKGMRIVENESELESSIERAMSEALAAFGDGSVFIEKYVSKPRHIEIQILADNYGNIVYLFERECSIQRRHQKVIEEAPSSILTEEKRKVMGEDAVKVAKSCSYKNAGTVEFLVDDQNNHYFLEINTRLQVEHPVTEMITGLDLVEQQILIAEGQPLSFTQDQLKINGHAIELRVYAENPQENFNPSVGKLVRYEPPQGPGIRVDDGYRKGMTIPIHYDPMISKLIVHAEDRTRAISLLLEAIDQYKIEGVETTLEFGKFAAQHQAFTSGNFDTRFVSLYMQEFLRDENKIDEYLARFAGWYFQREKDKVKT